MLIYMHLHVVAVQQTTATPYYQPAAHLTDLNLEQECLAHLWHKVLQACQPESSVSSISITKLEVE